jgi:predicted ferric reductase
LLGGVLAGAVVFRLGYGISGTKRYRVSQTRRLSPEVIEVDLDPLGRAMTFHPGQFIFARFRDPTTGWRCREFHPFTITSDPRESRLRIDIKKLGDTTRALLDINPGAIADVLGPFGGLFRGRRSTREVWLAGGIGITPFLSAARSLLLEDDATSIDLFYCTKRTAEAVHLEELRAIAERRPSFRVRHHVDESEGFLTADQVLSETGDGREAEFFIAGPPAFAAALREGLAVHQVTPRRIHTERFRYL